MARVPTYDNFQQMPAQLRTVEMQAAMPRVDPGAQAANFLGLLITAVLNTAANRAFTFGVRGLADAGKHQVQGLLVFGFALLITSGSLAMLHAWAPGASRLVELSVLVVANLVATVCRFLALRWVFRNNKGVQK